MKEMKINHGLHRLASLTLAIFGMAWVAGAATGTSGEFRVDLAGMGPWETRTARASEAISYSSTWATNALDGANAVVKVWPVKREKPKYIAIDLSGDTAVICLPRSPVGARLARARCGSPHNLAIGLAHCPLHFLNRSPKIVHRHGCHGSGRACRGHLVGRGVPPSRISQNSRVRFCLSTAV